MNKVLVDKHFQKLIQINWNSSTGTTIHYSQRNFSVVCTFPSITNYLLSYLFSSLFWPRCSLQLLLQSFQLIPSRRTQHQLQPTRLQLQLQLTQLQLIQLQHILSPLTNSQPIASLPKKIMYAIYVVLLFHFFFYFLFNAFNFYYSLRCHSTSLTK